MEESAEVYQEYPENRGERLLRPLVVDIELFMILPASAGSHGCEAVEECGAGFL